MTATGGGVEVARTHEDPGATTLSVPTRPRSGRAVDRGLLAALVLLAVEIAILVTVHVSVFVDLSPVDELAHFDNAVRSSAPMLVLDERDQLSQETLREVSCRRLHGDAWRVAPPGDRCLEQRYDPAEFWWRGLNSSVGHVPLYYLVTGLLARALRAIVPGFGLLTWARLLGIPWAIGGCYFTLRSAAMLGVSRIGTFAALALVVAVPSQLEAQAMVNPDAAMLFVGGFLLYAAIRIDSGAWRWWTVPPVIAAAMLIDPSAVVGILFFSAYLAVRALAGGPERVGRGRGIVLAATAVAVAAVTIAGWSVLFRSFTARADFAGSPQEVAYQTEHLPVADVLGSSAILALLPPTAQPNSPAALTSAPVQLMVAIGGLVIVGSLVGSVLRFRPPDRAGALAAATLGSLVMAAPLLILVNFTLSRLYFGIPSRYGLPALAPIAVVIAAGAATIGRVVTAAVGAGLFVATLAAML